MGVARQYCGERGKNDNCQTMVSLSVANEAASLPVAHRLFLPESWAGDAERRAKAKVSEAVVFQAKTEIALAQMKAALEQGIAKGIVLADAGYGSGAEFRKGINGLGLIYAVGIRPIATVWRPRRARRRRARACAGAGPCPRRCGLPNIRTGRSRRRTLPASCPPMPGRPSAGARAQMPRSPGASPGSGSAAPMATA